MTLAWGIEMVSVLQYMHNTWYSILPQNKLTILEI